MHWPKVSARTATPPGTNCVCGMIATSVTPAIALTWARLVTATALPLIVGGRHTIVGSAFGNVEVHRELLAAGDRVERVDPRLRGADDRGARLAA